MRKWLSTVIKAVLETTLKEANIATKEDLEALRKTNAADLETLRISSATKEALEEVRKEIISMEKNDLEHIYQAINATNSNVRAIAKAMEMLNPNLVIAIQDLPPLH